ncbi:hypothetical protein [Marinobacterium arenosum]|uniref:hypothetical protein n=1 Tax=Marinobacterium arenosum TaxID=2862496 RepID=UPI001C98643B|nr:hypothetical protein [Marinobacterium arenosum]MBY4675803.1 hypothetical protein [Marinobacterium arenosum]
MAHHCEHCIRLIESSFASEPHAELELLLEVGQDRVYRCRSCGSLFEFDDRGIYLLPGSALKSLESQAERQT